MLVDHELSGLIVGLTLGTRAEDVYRALIEATAFGTRKIIETFEASGLPVRELIVAGGLLKNPVIMQIYADVTRRSLHLIDSEQGPALGSAMHAAVAAGAYPDIYAAAAAMGKVRRDVYAPDEARAGAYDALYEHYSTLARPLRARRRRRHARAAPHPAARGRPWLTSSPSCAARSARCTPSCRATGSWRGRAATSPPASRARSSWSSRPAACPTTS